MQFLQITKKKITLNCRLTVDCFILREIHTLLVHCLKKRKRLPNCDTGEVHRSCLKLCAEYTSTLNVKTLHK